MRKILNLDGSMFKALNAEQEYRMKVSFRLKCNVVGSVWKVYKNKNL